MEIETINIEEAREYALSLPLAEESLFADDWVQYRVCGKWFMLIWLNAPEPRVAVKCYTDLAAELRERYNGVSSLQRHSLNSYGRKRFVVQTYHVTPNFFKVESPSVYLRRCKLRIIF